MVLLPRACAAGDNKKIVSDAVRVDGCKRIVVGLLNALQQADSAGIVGELAHPAFVTLGAVRHYVSVGGGYVQVLFGPGAGHVIKAALLLQLVALQPKSNGRQDGLDVADHKNGRPLQPLG